MTLNLSLAAVGREVGISVSQLSRVERGLAPGVPLDRIAATGAVLGLKLSVRFYPVGRPLRDSAQIALLERLRRRIHPTLGWRTEVPIPILGDLRAWDAAIVGRGWIVHVDAETRIRDAQAVARRTALKRRDSSTDRVILLVADTRLNRAVARSVASTLIADSRPAAEILAALESGRDPGGSALLLL